VDNLGWEIDENDLREVLQDVSGLSSAEVQYDKSGRSEGKAILVFASTRDAEAFIDEYDGVNLDDRPMKLSILPAERREMRSDASRGSLRRGGKSDLFGSRLRRSSDDRSGDDRRIEYRPKRRERNEIHGPRRERKNKSEEPITAEQLDAEMEAYMQQES